MVTTVGRRAVLSAVGGAIGAATVVRAADDESVVRVQGSYEEPITEAEAAAARERHHATLDRSVTASVTGDRRWVEYVVRENDGGLVEQLFGFATRGKVGVVRERAAAAVESPRRFDATAGPAWSRAGTDRTVVADQFGQLESDAQWYRAGSRHAFVSRVETIDDSFLPFGRSVGIDHGWDESEFDDVALIDASPNTATTGEVTGSVGTRASRRLSFDFEFAGRITQAGTPPATVWRAGVPRSGEHTLWGGSVIEGTASSGDRIVTLGGRARWRPLYGLTATMTTSLV